MKPSAAPLILALSVAALILYGCGKNDIASSTQVLAKVGDKEITTSFFNRQIGNLPESIQKLTSNGEGKKAILDALVSRELLYAAAIEKKIDKNPDLQKKIEDQKKELIVNSYLQSELIGKITVEDKEAENFYAANPGEFRNREELRLSQIVVPDEDKAREILQKLSIRREFGELAQAHSTDKISAERKGDAGWFTRSKLPAQVRDSLFRLRVGEVSRPFKMDGGYEIYRVTDRRQVSYSFTQVKDAIKAQLFNDKFKQELKILVDKQKKTVKVQLNEALLK
jgi:peptidyl-prolyl cis-trans isomerase C